MIKNTYYQKNIVVILSENRPCAGIFSGVDTVFHTVKNA